MADIVWDAEAQEIFYKFIYERHSIWNRRFVKRIPQPWTHNIILQKNKFTNIYRELDPGTVFARELMALPYSRADIVFNVMIYRLIVSIPTYRKMGFQTLDDFDWLHMHDVFKSVYDTGEPVFGNAYLISPYSSMGSDIKYKNVALLFREIHRTFAAFFERLDSATTFEQGFKAINSLYGFGPFLAFQVMVDLTYPSLNYEGEPILPFSQNEWARLGPGAQRGLARMTRAYTNADRLTALRWLWYHQHEKFLEYGLKFPYLKDANGVDTPISLANMQNCLCEFSKYMNIRAGSGKAQRLFVPREKRGSA